MVQGPDMYVVIGLVEEGDEIACANGGSANLEIGEDEEELFAHGFFVR